MTLTTSFRLTLVCALWGVAAFADPPAVSIDNGACCVQSTSRLETLLNPQRGSDEQFFTSAGGPPNVMFILDTSCSMKAWPENWPTTRGCNHPTFAGAGYDKSTDYPSFISGMTGPAGNKQPVYDTKWYDNKAVYRADGSASFNTPPAIGHNFANNGGPGGTKWTGATIAAARTSACASFSGITAAEKTACEQCLENSGYYVWNSTTRIAEGNYLEFYSPRDVSAVLTLSQLLFDVREVRLGVMTFDDWGSTACYSPGSDSDICLWQPLGPNCNQLYPLDTSAVENQRNAILNSLAKNNKFDSRTPLASTLYLAAYHLRSKSPDAFTSLFGASFPSKSALDEPNSWQQKSICTGCSFNASIILTDGEPNTEEITNFPSAISTFGSPQTAALCPPGTGECDSQLDEIAAFFWNKDLRADLNNPTVQKMATYTIGFATATAANQLLASTAKVGGGKYYSAKGAAAIKQSILDILDDIQSRNNSFSSSAVASVQTGSTSEPALLPRMMPKKGLPWEGKLWRFKQFNEFVEDQDLNGDSDKEDIFIVEGVANPTSTNIVTESSDGTFVRAGTSTAATPFWEANAKLVTDLAANGLNSRNVYTVFDTYPSPGGDGAFTNADTMVKIGFGASIADDLRLAQYMGLRGSSFCPNASSTGSLLAKFGMSMSQAQTVTGLSAPTTADQYDQLCVRIVVRWLQGADLFDGDGDGILNEVRQNVLGDIFHASPVLVDPPVDPFLCDLGLSTQCARTLYSQNLGGLTPTPAGTVPNTPVCGAAINEPYQWWVATSVARPRLALVGSNDGMVHAFLSGVGTASCTGSVATATHTDGTGQELWAFVPPDLLPKVPDLILGHEYMVDGDIMVRDIWTDIDQDGKKDANEFRTLAIVSEGRGGKHYVALDLFPGGGITSNQPEFRWMFPQPCTEEAATFGKTFFSLSPKPPPVGPVLINADGLPANNPFGAGAQKIPRLDVDTYERWVVALSGGWSPGLEKGRGVYFVDAWEGQINDRRDNLWWKFEFSEGASGFATPARNLTQSVSGPVALVDYGSNAEPMQDGFFDTAVFGDTAGQMWVARFHAPGKYSSAHNQIGNWSAARAFEMDRYGAAGAGVITMLPDGGQELPDPNAKSVTNRSPFYYLPSVAIEPGTNRMRVFAGTGNRYAILEGGAGMCRFDNPLACSKSLCSDIKVLSTYEDGVVDINKMETHWKSRRFEHSKLDESVTKSATATLTSADTCGSSGSVQVKAENQDFKVGTCDYPSGSDPNPGQVNEIAYSCGLDSAGTGQTFLCKRTGVTRNGGLGDLVDLGQVDTLGVGNNRFFGFWAYGGPRVFVESPDGGPTPTTFDNLRFTDRADVDAGLIDVTNVVCQANGTCDGGAAPSQNGWYYDYGVLDRKTATGSAVIASCVLWSDLSPTGGDGGVCGASITPLSRIYQADFITGQPNCAYGFLPTDGGAYVRSVGRTVVAPPPEPASVVQVSKNGEVRYSAMIVEPGQGQATTVNVSGGQDVLQLVYELPVSRSLHNCRHEPDGGCAANP